MPKWNDRAPQMPVGGVVPRKRREHPMVDIGDEPPALRDSRTPVEAKPMPKHPERLKIDANPAPDGIRYDIENIGGKATYIVMLVHDEDVFGNKPEKHNGFVPVPGISSRTGTWKGYLIVDDVHIVDVVDFELDLTVQWLAEEMGRVDIRFGDTDGMIDRMGAIRVDPWPKQDRTDVDADAEDVAICILFPDLPDRMPNPTPEFIIQIDRPGEGGIYFRDTAPLAEVAGYRLKVREYLPSTEPGDWHIRVLLEDRVLGRTTMRIAGTHGAAASKSENPVEDLAVNIVG